MSSPPLGSLGSEVTDTTLAIPWLQRSRGQASPHALHLAVLWFYDEPERVGQLARIDADCHLGRSHGALGHVPYVRFVFQRPGTSVAAGDLLSSRISRRQLDFSDVSSDSMRVRNVGRRALFVNGSATNDCVVHPGDTLMLEHTAVFLVEARPIVMDPLAYYGGEAFAFGEPDAQGMVGESVAAWRLRDQLAAAAISEAHVVLFGATGVGKEVAARAIHGLSKRERGPMVARNAATIPGSLLDAELFGNAKHYPNATSPERQGLVGAAHTGHLLLDEVGELPQEHQAHLLRVMDNDGAYQRLGETRPRSSDFRLIAATNRAPSCLKQDFLARFRQRIVVPDLNERRSDIPFLLKEIARAVAVAAPRFAARFMDSGPIMRVRLEPALVDAFARHRYTEHTRELARLLQVAMVTSPGEYLQLTPEVERELSACTVEHPDETREKHEAVTPEAVREALSLHQGNVTRAAQQLGMSRHALRRLMKRYGLARPD